ncbi:HEPN domain-containing protein [Sulfobacillus thermosulfidooxidans]|uniref:HEPN domain-containing protein n=1 Tax=Sulfobacillus thermosulfidooxidans TaxID=28034 RepID=UPI0006B5031D|nr:HEPN domain-containing protein [Sulfobacillus thermosulfidooxidans]
MVVQRVDETFTIWLQTEGCLPSYVLAPLWGLHLPAELRLQLDTETLVRPVTREDVEALFNPLPSFPVVSILVPLVPRNELVHIQHVIEYRPRNCSDPTVDSCDRGIQRVLMAFRCIFGAKITSSWLAVMSDVPVPMVAGRVVHPPYRGPYGNSGNAMWDNEQEADLHRIYSALGHLERDSRLRIALRWYNKAADQSEVKDRLLSAWIGLEALYGGGDKGEIVHKLSLRAAFYLSKYATGFPNVNETFQTLKNLYEFRSSVVHGDTRQKRNQLGDAADRAMEILRLTLRAALIKKEQFPPADKLANKLDEDIRNALTKVNDLLKD